MLLEPKTMPPTGEKLSKSVMSRSLYLDDLVTMKLKSSWGRPTGPVEQPGILPELHKRIAAIKEGMGGHEKEWTRILERCSSHPKEVVLLDRRGRTCLAAACTKKPPAEVVQALLKECHFGADCLRDKHGRTPLAIAINANASLEVITKLVSRRKVITISDHGGNAPLHLACLNEYRFGVEDLVKVLIEAAPDVAKLENNKGKLPLHLALEAKSSSKVIQMLAKSCPETVANDTCGYAPLMIAIQYSADIEVFRFLVEANPNITLKRDDGRLPLRRALEFRCNHPGIIDLLCTSEESVMETDKIGRNALHLGLEWITVVPQMIKTLLKEAPQASRVHSPCTGTPLQMAYQRYARSVRNVEYHGISPNQSSLQDMEDWWNVTCAILKAATFVSTIDKRALTKDGRWSILHSALITNAPTQVLKTILQRHVTEVNLPNQDGRCPLMLAATLNKNDKVKECVLNMLLDADAAGPASLPDNGGRYALSVAAENNGISTSVRYRIVCAYPEALRVVDPIHSLYPFLVAALPREETISNRMMDPTTISNLQTTCIYELLMAAPEVLSFCGKLVDAIPPQKTTLV